MSADRFAVPLDELERTVRVAGAAQVEVQAAPRPSDAVFDVTPACGGGGADADGE